MLADGQHTLRNMGSEFLNNPGEIVTNDPAILSILEYTAERLP
jgi:hypothetical protein